MPRIAVTGQAYSHSDHENKDSLGRVSLIKEGTRQEAVSVYCRRHGCSFMKRCHEALSKQQLEMWFHLGQDIPKGRTAALQARHKALLQTL